jgi:hypothetical protein
MVAPRIWRDQVWESGTKYNRARLVDRNGTLAIQGDFSGVVTTRVYDMAAADIDDPVYSNTTAISSADFNSLQDWEVDGTGYNFEVSIDSNSVAMDGGHTYRACHSLTHTTEGVWTLVFEMKAETILSM